MLFFSYGKVKFFLRMGFLYVTLNGNPSVETMFPYGVTRKYNCNRSKIKRQQNLKRI